MDYGFILLLAAMSAALAPFIWLYLRQDYSGKNSARRDRIQTQFGSEFVIAPRFGLFRVRSKSLEPSESAALEIGRILWTDGGKLRKGAAVPFFQVLDSLDHARYVVCPGASDKGECILSMRIVGGWPIPKKVLSKMMLLESIGEDGSPVILTVPVESL